MDGLLLINKPSGWTSFDVVAKVRGTLRQAQIQKLKAKSSIEKPSALNLQPSTPLPKVKVGHTGTLDPLATGLLILTIGSYCKRASEFSGLDKTYEVTMKLGQTSTTGDEEGEKSAISNQQPTIIEIQDAFDQFTGEIMQTPPAYSAINVNGQRAYKLARAGKEVKLEPRQITVYQITDVKYSYPEVVFTAKVSSGTYIRSLVEDIGKALSTGAYMSGLCRTQIGTFNLNDAVSPDVVNVGELIITQAKQ